MFIFDLVLSKWTVSIIWDNKITLALFLQVIYFCVDEMLADLEYWKGVSIRLVGKAGVS